MCIALIIHDLRGWLGGMYQVSVSLVSVCSDFIEMREGHFTAKSLRMLFQDISPEKIFNFLKILFLFGKI